ncbi:hypothetical protein [Neobacillus vireti]|uniref:hypothetical protein n=1 Tax=Neobacillus vireti TaxID=220686 RepID=UPI00300060E9
MRKLLSVCLLLMLSLTGCRSPLHQDTVIDWVDFVKWNGVEYDGIFNGVLADKRFLDKKIGEVKFQVADHVSDPEYKTKDGDAAFHEKGTPIYSIKGEPNIIALKSSDSINGYSVYYSRESKKYRWLFQDMPVEKVNKIEIYQLKPANTKGRLTELNNSVQISHFIQFFKNSKESPNFEPNTEKGDPLFYQVVFYTGEAIACLQNLQYDGYTYYWFPNETAIISNDIQAFFPN